MTFSEPELWLTSNPARLAEAAAELFTNVGREAVSQRGRFTIALAGGNTPRRAYEALAREPWRSEVDWSRTYLFWGDERCVPPDHPDSNYRMVAEALLSRVPIPEGHVFRIPAELPDPAQAAQRYEETLRSFFGVSPNQPPRFDLVLLGLGEDGHTASLFPGTTAILEKERMVVAVWVAKLHTHRITLTLPVLNAARTVAFLVSGASKAEILRKVLSVAPAAGELPARLIQPRDGTLFWLVDEEAASRLDLSSPSLAVRRWPSKSAAGDISRSGS